VHSSKRKGGWTVRYTLWRRVTENSKVLKTSGWAGVGERGEVGGKGVEG